MQPLSLWCIESRFNAADFMVRVWHDNFDRDSTIGVISVEDMVNKVVNRCDASHQGIQSLVIVGHGAQDIKPWGPGPIGIVQATRVSKSTQPIIRVGACSAVLHSHCPDYVADSVDLPL